MYNGAKRIRRRNITSGTDTQPSITYICASTLPRLVGSSNCVPLPMPHPSAQTNSRYRCLSDIALRQVKRHDRKSSLTHKLLADKDEDKTSQQDDEAEAELQTPPPAPVAPSPSPLSAPPLPVPLASSPFPLDLTHYGVEPNPGPSASTSASHSSSPSAGSAVSVAPLSAVPTTSSVSSSYESECVVDRDCMMIRRGWMQYAQNGWPIRFEFHMAPSAYHQHHLSTNPTTGAGDVRAKDHSHRNTDPALSLNPCIAHYGSTSAPPNPPKPASAAFSRFSSSDSAAASLSLSVFPSHPVSGVLHYEGLGRADFVGSWDPRTEAFDVTTLPGRIHVHEHGQMQDSCADMDVDPTGMPMLAPVRYIARVAAAAKPTIRVPDTLTRTAAPMTDAAARRSANTVDMGGTSASASAVASSPTSTGYSPFPSSISLPSASSPSLPTANLVPASSVASESLVVSAPLSVRADAFRSASSISISIGWRGAWTDLSGLNTRAHGSFALVGADVEKREAEEWQQRILTVKQEQRQLAAQLKKAKKEKKEQNNMQQRQETRRTPPLASSPSPSPGPLSYSHPFYNYEPLPSFLTDGSSRAPAPASASSVSVPPRLFHRYVGLAQAKGGELIGAWLYFTAATAIQGSATSANAVGATAPGNEMHATTDHDAKVKAGKGNRLVEAVETPASDLNRPGPLRLRLCGAYSLRALGLEGRVAGEWNEQDGTLTLNLELLSERWIARCVLAMDTDTDSHRYRDEAQRTLAAAATETTLEDQLAAISKSNIDIHQPHVLYGSRCDGDEESTDTVEGENTTRANPFAGASPAFGALRFCLYSVSERNWQLLRSSVPSFSKPFRIHPTMLYPEVFESSGGIPHGFGFSVTGARYSTVFELEHGRCVRSALSRVFGTAGLTLTAGYRGILDHGETELPTVDFGVLHHEYRRKPEEPEPRANAVKKVEEEEREEALVEELGVLLPPAGEEDKDLSNSSDSDARQLRQWREIGYDSALDERQSIKYLVPPPHIPPSAAGSTPTSGSASSATGSLPRGTDLQDYRFVYGVYRNGRAEGRHVARMADGSWEVRIYERGKLVRKEPMTSAHYEVVRRVPQMFVAMRTKMEQQKKENTARLAAFQRRAAASPLLRSIPRLPTLCISPDTLCDPTAKQQVYHLFWGDNRVYEGAVYDGSQSQYRWLPHGFGALYFADYGTLPKHSDDATDSQSSRSSTSTRSSSSSSSSDTRTSSCGDDRSRPPSRAPVSASPSSSSSFSDAGPEGRRALYEGGWRYGIQHGWGCHAHTDTDHARPPSRTVQEGQFVRGLADGVCARMTDTAHTQSLCLAPFWGVEMRGLGRVTGILKKGSWSNVSHGYGRPYRMEGIGIRRYESWVHLARKENEQPRGPYIGLDRAQARNISGRKAGAYQPMIRPFVRHLSSPELYAGKDVHSTHPLLIAYATAVEQQLLAMDSMTLQWIQQARRFHQRRQKFAQLPLLSPPQYAIYYFCDGCCNKLVASEHWQCPLPDCRIDLCAFCKGESQTGPSLRHHDSSHPPLQLVPWQMDQRVRHRPANSRKEGTQQSHENQTIASTRSHTAGKGSAPAPAPVQPAAAAVSNSSSSGEQVTPASLLAAPAATLSSAWSCTCAVGSASMTNPRPCSHDSLNQQQQHEQTQPHSDQTRPSPSDSSSSPSRLSSPFAAALSMPPTLDFTFPGMYEGRFLLPKLRKTYRDMEMGMTTRSTGGGPGNQKRRSEKVHPDNIQASSLSPSNENRASDIAISSTPSSLSNSLGSMPSNNTNTTLRQPLLASHDQREQSGYADIDLHPVDNGSAVWTGLAQQPSSNSESTPSSSFPSTSVAAATPSMHLQEELERVLQLSDAIVAMRPIGQVRKAVPPLNLSAGLDRNPERAHATPDALYRGSAWEHGLSSSMPEDFDQLRLDGAGRSRSQLLLLSRVGSLRPFLRWILEHTRDRMDLAILPNRTIDACVVLSHYYSLLQIVQQELEVDNAEGSTGSGTSAAPSNAPQSSSHKLSSLTRFSSWLSSTVKNLLDAHLDEDASTTALPLLDLWLRLQETADFLLACVSIRSG